MIQFPDNLISIHDQLIDYINTNSPAPEGLDQLVNWIETECLFDSLTETWEGERCALQLIDFANYNFCDPELISYEVLSEPITNQMRVAFARKLIRNTFLDSDGYQCPSIHVIHIQKDDKTSAVLCWIVEIHGQAGPAPKFCGAFSCNENFFQHLRDNNYVLNDEEELISYEVILSLWGMPSTNQD